MSNVLMELLLAASMLLGTVDGHYRTVYGPYVKGYEDAQMTVQAYVGATITCTTTGELYDYFDYGDTRYMLPHVTRLEEARKAYWAEHCDGGIAP